MLVDESNDRAWTEIAHGTRLHWRVLVNVGEPKAESNFARVHELYPYERVADRARAYIYAALEHLMLWADVVAPFKFHPEQANVFQQRPPYTLARAALEASAQAVWMLNTTDPLECIRRHLCLIRWDLQEHRKSTIDGERRRAVDEREVELLQRITGVMSERDTRPPRGYLSVLQMACDADGLELDEGQVERLWRAASGSAHGMFWPTLELQHLIELEDEAGVVQTVRMPDADGMTEVLRAAYKMTQHAVLQYANYAGADVHGLIADAMEWLIERVPLKADADPTVIGQLRTAGGGMDQTE
jgi:hypothetical protein